MRFYTHIAAGHNLPNQMTTTATITSIEPQPRDTFFVTITPDRQMLTAINFDLSGFGTILRVMGDRVLVSGKPGVSVGDAIEATSVPSTSWQTGDSASLPVLSDDAAAALKSQWAANFSAFRNA